MRQSFVLWGVFSGVWSFILVGKGKKGTPSFELLLIYVLFFSPLFQDNKRGFRIYEISWTLDRLNVI